MASGEIASLSPAGASDRLRTSVLALFVGVFLVLWLRSSRSAPLLYRQEMLTRRAAPRRKSRADPRRSSRPHRQRDRHDAGPARAARPVRGPAPQAAASASGRPGARGGARRTAPASRSLAVTDATGIIRASTIPMIVGQSRADLFICSAAFRRSRTPASSPTRRSADCSTGIG